MQEKLTTLERATTSTWNVCGIRSSATAPASSKPRAASSARVAPQRLRIARHVDDAPARARRRRQVRAVGALARRIQHDGVGRAGRRAQRPRRARARCAARARPPPDRRRDAATDVGDGTRWRVKLPLPA